MEEGIEYLREMAMVGMVYGINLDDNTNSHDEDDRKCTWSMWQRVVVLYISTLAIMNWKYNKRPTVDEVASLLWLYEDSLSSSLWVCFPCGETVPGLKAIQRWYVFLPTFRNQISSIKNKYSLRKREDSVGTHHKTFCFCLCHCEEERKTWDEKPTSALQTQVCELQGKTITRVSPSRKMVALVYSRQF